MIRARGPSLIFFLGALLITLVPFLSVLLHPDQACLYRDISNVWLPYKAVWTEAVLALGRVPHWDPRHTAGFPFLADINYGPLYPLNLFFLIGSAPFARRFTYWIVLHHVLLAAGRFALLRDLRLRPWLCAVGALAAAWCGPALSADDLVHDLAGQAAVGFFLFAWARALRREKLGAWIFAASAALAWPIYGGDPQFAYLLALCAAGSLLLRRHRRWRTVGKLGALGLLTALAAAPQLLPTGHQLVKETRILDHVEDSERLGWSLAPMRLAELLVPLPFGDTPGTFRFPALLDSATEPFLFSLYAGALPFTLALASLAFRRGRRLTLFLFFLLAGASLGVHSPLPVYSWAIKILPLWDHFRFPERLTFWLVLLIQLRGFRAAELLLRLKRRSAAVLAAPVLATVALASLFGIWLWSKGASPLPAAQSAALALGLGIAFLGLRARGRALAISALVLFDMAPIAQRLVWTAPITLTEPTTYPWAQKILQDRAARGDARKRGEADRFFSSVARRLQPTPRFGALTTEASSVYSVWGGGKFNTPSTWGFSLARGHTVMTPERPVLELVALSPEFAHRALNLLGVRYILVPGSPEPMATVSTEALPHAFFPPSTKLVTGAEELRQALVRPKWELADEALLESAQALLATKASTPEILEVRQDWDLLEVKARAKVPSAARWLVVNEAYDAQWRAKVGTQEAPIVRANGWAMAVAMPPLTAGQEITLTMSFRDRWFEAGLVALLAWLVLFAVGALRPPTPRPC